MFVKRVRKDAPGARAALYFDFGLATICARFAFAVGGERMSSVVTKSDLVQVAAKAGNVSKAAAGEAVNALFDAIVANVAKGKRVTVVGFGTFLPRKRKARAGRSPANGKEIRIPAKTLPAFAAGQGFKEAVDKS